MENVQRRQKEKTARSAAKLALVGRQSNRPLLPGWSAKASYTTLLMDMSVCGEIYSAL
jgi:hypothetical protein